MCFNIYNAFDRKIKNKKHRKYYNKLNSHWSSDQVIKMEPKSVLHIMLSRLGLMMCRLFVFI